ncbi:unnamed protein product [Linum trigynum]|uniref:No apical meristem-associated C-terminal domain-containing protein n=1 Tax=Linum trigynum TaxID=586398 RepID=A0AAV2G5E4_9ROSI
MGGSSLGLPSGESDSRDVQAIPFVINRLEVREKQEKKKRGTPYSSSESWDENMANLVYYSNTHMRLALAREEREVEREAKDRARELREKNRHEMMVMNNDLSQMSPRSWAWYQRQKDDIMASY